MEPGDDDERANAYKRHIFNEFADIVHHYDDTAFDVVHDQLNNHNNVNDDDNDFGDNYDFNSPTDNGCTHDNCNCDDDSSRNDDFHNLDYLDGAEYDNNGDPIIQFGLIVADAINEYGSFDDIPDDYEFGTPVNDEYLQQRFNEFIAAALVEQFKFRLASNIFQYPLYNPFRGRCKRPRGEFHYHRGGDSSLP